MDTECMRNPSSGNISPDIESKIQEILQVFITEQRSNYSPSMDVSLQSTGRVKSDHSVYCGYGGNLYLFWRLSNFAVSYQEDLQACVNTVLRKLPNIPDEVSTFLMGKAGICALLAVITKNEEYATMVLESTKNDPEEFELLYGAAGTLYALGFILKHWPETTQKALIIASIQRIAEKTVEKKDGNNELHFRYPFHGGDSYIGAAHGIIGILYVLFQLREYLPNNDNIFIPTLEYLIKLQFPTGNFPAIEGPEVDDTVHFCHGGPGAVPMLCLAYQIYNHQDYLQAALRAGEDIWRRGLLKKGRGICHGTAGNGYAFISLFNVTGEEVWLNRALIFAEIMGYDQNYENVVRRFDDPQRKTLGIADHPYSLMEGLAGTICFYIDCLNPLEAMYPTYDI